MKLLSIILSIVVSASIDSTTLKVGDQTAMHLEVTQDAGDHVSFPVYGNQLIDGIEIVKHLPQDTTRLKDGRLTVRQDLILTCFQDSLFYIEPQRFISGEDTFTTSALSLNVVQPFIIDTTDVQIFDVKDIVKAPIWWWGIIRWILLGLGIIAVGIGIYFLVRYLKQRRKAETEQPVDPELLRPAHEVALEKLDKIREEKLYVKGLDKQYQTELTDVVREYLARRFDVSSQEMTSDEILAEMKPLLQEQKELYTLLDRMLRLADLVKFAKHRPTPDENETSLRSAYRIVQETIPAPPQDADADADDNDDTDEADE